jgi:hypothetical protein
MNTKRPTPLPLVRLLLAGTLSAAALTAQVRTASALEVFGCTLWVAPAEKFWSETKPCLDRKLQELLTKGVELVDGCRLSFVDIGASLGCFTKWLGQKADEAVRAITGMSIAETAELVKSLAECGAQGLADVGDVFRSLAREPASFVRKALGDVWELLRAGLQPLFASSGAMLADLANLAQGEDLPDGSLDRLFAWLWNGVKALGAKVKSVGCVVKLAEPILQRLKAGVFGLVRTLVSGARDLFTQSVLPKLSGLLVEGVDKLVGVILGAAAKERLREMAAKALDPAARVGAIAAKLKSFAAALRKGDAVGTQTQWRDARSVLYDGENDFGVRRLGELVTTFVRWGTGELIEKIGRRVITWLAKVPSQGLNLVNRIVDGVCGLIPEAGAAICTVVVTGVLRLAWDIVGSTAVQKAALVGLKGIADAVVHKVGAVITDRLAGKVGAAVAGSDDAAKIAAAMTPVIRFVLDGIKDWAQPRAEKYQALYESVVKMGNKAVEIVTGQRPAEVRK